MSASHHISMMQSMGAHALILTRLKPYPGIGDPASYARLAYHHMRLAGLSPWPENNLNLNIA